MRFNRFNGFHDHTGSTSKRDHRIPPKTTKNQKNQTKKPMNTDPQILDTEPRQIGGMAQRAI